MKTQYRPIAMRCTQEQFNSIRDRIPLPIVRITEFGQGTYLTNNYHGDSLVSNVHEELISNYHNKIFNTFDGELFLDCCGREIITGGVSGQILSNDSDVTQQGDLRWKTPLKMLSEKDKQQIIDEYLKDKVWKGSELQYEKNGKWIDCNDFNVRLKPQPDYTAEIEALERKAK